MTTTDQSARVPDGWARSFRNLPREHGFEPLHVTGILPRDLEGTFYRNGPGSSERFGEAYGHWFDGDGAVTAVRLESGRATGAVRFVETLGRERERRAARPLFGGYNTRPRRPIRELLLGDTKNPANTSVMLWQHRLFALCEAGKPYEVDRESLMTLGETDFGDVVVRALSAHPHASPKRRALYDFGLENGPNAKIHAYELPPLGRARRIASFSLDGPTFVHDFAVTERYLVFHLAPMRMRLLPLLLRRSGPYDSLEWRAERGTELVVVPIDEPSAMFRIQTEAHLCEHTVNAFEQGGTIQLDFIRYDTMRGLEDYVGKLAQGVVRAPLRSSVSRCVIDLAKKRAHFEERLAAPCELPRVSPHVETARHRYVYLAGFSSTSASETGPFDAIVKLDVERGTTERFAFGPGQRCGEAVFVPRRVPSAEDDGHLLSFVYDGATDATHLAILDARALGAGPVARAAFDHHIPTGFHGIWVPHE